MHSKWFYTQSKIKKAVILLAHGLNLNPSKMDELGSFFYNHHCDVLRIGLGNDPDFWEASFEMDFKAAKKYADEQQCPLYFVGFSLGALLGMHYLLKKDSNAFKKMALLAPATHTHFYAVVPAFLAIFFPKGFLPSLNLKNYRLRSFTTFLEYKKMFELQKAIKEELKEPITIPTLLVTSPKDELINSKGLNNWAEKSPLWQTVKISNKLSQLPRKYHHLMIDEASLGKSEWEKLLQSFRVHFDL